MFLLGTSTPTAGSEEIAGRTYAAGFIRIDIKPLFRDIDILHMRRYGVQLGDHGYMSNPNSGSAVLANVSPHDAFHAARRTLLDGGTTRIVCSMAEGRIPAVTFASGQWRPSMCSNVPLVFSLPRLLCSRRKEFCRELI